MKEEQKELLENKKVEDRPPCTVTELNEPNMELMARAFIKSYYNSLAEGK